MAFTLPTHFYSHQWTFLPALPKGPFLKDKTVIISGSNSGVGLEATKQLATYSPSRLILAVRSLDSGEKVAKSLRVSHPGVQIEAWFLDLNDIQSVKDFAVKAEGLDRLDVLINNAGINPGIDPVPLKLTKDGYERTLQTNVLSTLLLTLLLEPLLTRTSHIAGAGTPVVVFVGSDIHFIGDHTPILDAINSGTSLIAVLNDKENYENAKRYGVSKVLLQMVTRSLIQALPHLRIINTNPGLSRTNIGRELQMKMSLSMIRMIIWFISNSRSAYSGAKNITTAVVNSTDSVDYWSECTPSPSENTFLATGEGYRATKFAFKQISAECEKIAPGCTAGLSF
ncbi:hypothetical protein BCR39DRAFT_363431 [Naematelia encephala]|uniref:Short-chain dehydrogenase n=1 Tax=Naematelia encephala TaxID=71784 RepID=A0A1Y2AKT7_9TREE|nr:hypothetical protein BCR39DRAFT_363431 [Naematelia encephala]